MVDKKKLKRVVPNLLTDGAITEFENEYRRKRRLFLQMNPERKNSLLFRLQRDLEQLDYELSLKELLDRKRGGARR